MLSRVEIEENIKIERYALKKLAKQGISVDMTRGRPSKEQLVTSMTMLENATSYTYEDASGDARNYGELQGIDRARALFAQIFGVKKEEVIVGDGSSLSLMYRLVQYAMQFGICGNVAWNNLDKVKFICPSPGYDRHFFICEKFGIDMIGVPMLEDGPDMNIVETLVRDDDSIKGIWCVPKYSNPTGVVYSDKVVDRLAKLKTAASDFRIFWDNAYALHPLYDEDIKLKNIFDACQKYGNVDRVYSFTSTSKITFAGSGVAAIATSKNNVQDILNNMKYELISPNKVNQVLHVEYLKDLDNIKRIMALHASVLRPKFELFEEKMSDAFKDDDYVRWTRPRGGYFISLDVKHIASRVVNIANDNGVKFTPAGSTYPYHLDDMDQNIRIAPTVPNIDELTYAIDVLIHAIKLARLEYELSLIVQ